MIVTLSDVKTYLRLDQDATEEEALLQLLINAAESYLKNATGIQFDGTNDLAKILCLVLITDWYEHREMVGKVSEQVRFTISSILTQLQYCYPPPPEVIV